MGQEEFHVYHFACQGCGEEMAVGLRVDFEAVAHSVEEVENVELVEEEAGFSIMNLHANFVIQKELQHVDKAFPHFERMTQQAEAAEAAGSLVSLLDVPPKSLLARPYRRPDFDNEWRKLKKAWSLWQRDRKELCDQILQSASKEFYSDHPLKHIQDWVWRFALYTTGPHYALKLRAAVDLVAPAFRDGRFWPLMSYYESQSGTRAKRYFEILKEYFAGWSEFSQVHFAVGHGLGADDLAATSTDFKAVNMFYGNAYETFASSVDVIVMINNVLAGRPFDQLASVPLKRYLASSKASRFDAFNDTVALASLCTERDNRLRNASHHRDMNYDPETGRILYYVGTGSSRERMTMTYAEYLVRCSRIYHQILMLLSLELLLCQNAGVSCPV